MLWSARKDDTETRANLGRGRARARARARGRESFLLGVAEEASRSSGEKRRQNEGAR